jgi:biopolymer transport protein ExbD
MELVRKSRTSPKLFSSVDATSFASILVVVTIIFLVVASMSHNPHHGVSVDMPRVMHPVAMSGALRDDAMKVFVLRDGQVYFGSDRVWSGDLAQRIQNRLQNRGVERKVYITVDMRARWSDVETVLDGVRSAGILRVAFLTGQGQSPKITH